VYIEKGGDKCGKAVPRETERWGRRGKRYEGFCSVILNHGPINRFFNLQLFKKEHGLDRGGGTSGLRMNTPREGGAGGGATFERGPETTGRFPRGGLLEKHPANQTGIR